MPSLKERRAVIEDSHEPIIDSLVWEKVKTLRQNKRRPTKTGATSIFSGLLYCADCGAKLSLNVSNGYRYFRCSGYKRNSRKKACSIHYIRESVLEQLKRRTVEIERLFRKIYEDNANGKITDEQFYRLSEGYETELADAKTEIDTLTGEVKDTDTAVTNVEKLIAVTRRYTRIDKLTPEILNALVDKIVVQEAEKKDGKRTQSIDIYYSYVGIVNIPTAEEMVVHAAKQTASKTA